MEFVNPGEATYANVLIYGPPKTGKTSGAATAPGMVLYLNADLRNATRYAHSRDKQGRIKEPAIPAYVRGATPVFDLMTEIVKQAYQENSWDTIVVDPIGELYRRLLEEQSQRSRRPTLDQRGNAWTDVERWLRALFEAPVNVVVVAHQMQADQGEDGLVAIPFVGTKSASEAGLGPKLEGMVDIIAYTAVVEVEGEPEPRYMAQLVHGKGRHGGDRFNVLGTYREVNLTEWFLLADVHTGEVVDAPAVSGREATNQQEAIAA